MGDYSADHRIGQAFLGAMIEDEIVLPWGEKLVMVTVTSVLTRQRDDVSRQRILVRPMLWLIALRAAPLLQNAARLPFAHPVLSGRIFHCALRDLEVSLATSFRICFSKDSSTTKRSSLAFSPASPLNI